MSFFKDFKDDFSAAMDEMMPGGESEPAQEKEEDLVVDTFTNDNQDADLSDIGGLFEKSGETDAPKGSMDFTKTVGAPSAQTATANAPLSFTAVPPVQEERPVASDETTIITAGTVIHGDIESIGSLDISGQISGDLKCRGKLTVSGDGAAVVGNSSAEEVFVDSAHVQGEIVSNGTVKIGLGSVIIGNVSANSAVIAGAIKGDIDVHGPVVVDTSAVVVGNIKSRSVQINNGAVIEGFCSQAYAEIDVDGLFGKQG